MSLKDDLLASLMLEDIKKEIRKHDFPDEDMVEEFAVEILKVVIKGLNRYEEANRSKTSKQKSKARK